VLKTKPIVFDEISKFARITLDDKLEIKGRSGVWKEVVHTIPNRKQYICVWLNGETFRAHRILCSLRLRKDISSDLYVHHIDGDKANNSQENLKLVTPQEHAQERHPRNKHLKVGAHYHTTHKKWTSDIVIGRKKISLGYFSTELEANEAYLIAAEIRNLSISDEEKIAKIKKDSYTQKRRKKGILKGAYFSRGKWIGMIKENSKTRYLGSFSTQQEAHLAYIAAGGHEETLL
jgi:hypothetical protein